MQKEEDQEISIKYSNPILSFPRIIHAKSHYDAHEQKHLILSYKDAPKTPAPNEYHHCNEQKTNLLGNRVDPSLIL